MNSTTLINELTDRTTNHLNRAQQLLDLDTETLNYKSNAESWSVLECIEHLNRYGDFYLPELKDRIQNAQHTGDGEFKSGWLGNYFANSMLPKEKGGQMKTFKSMNPVGSKLSKETLHKFIRQQQETLVLLEAANNVCLTKTKTGISITNLIKLRLGDTFRVVIYHNGRHLLQAERVLAVLPTV